MSTRNEAFWKYLSLALTVTLIGVVIYLASTMAELNAKRQSPYNYSQDAAFGAVGPGSRGENGGNIYWVADLVESSLPFVVNVSTVTSPSGAGESSDNSDSGVYKDLPGQQREQQQYDGEPYEWFRKQFPGLEIPDDRQFNAEIPPMLGVGSGFIVSENGHIVTNAHVVQNADEITVTLNDGREFKAELVGTDMLKDIAVLKIDAGNLPVAPMGDSDILRIGEPAVAIGSPFGLEATVTQGIISTTARDPNELHMPTDVRRVRKLIQTDASINQGNSGGPLLNARAEVIGVNQAILPYARGIGFAIPINEVKGTIDQIIKEGHVVYPGLGIRVGDVTPENREELKVGVSNGAYVAQVDVNGPGDRAGIEAGDVVLEVDGASIANSDDLITAIQLHAVGDKMTLLLARGGSKEKLKKVVVILGELDTSEF